MNLWNNSPANRDVHQWCFEVTRSEMAKVQVDWDAFQSTMAEGNISERLHALYVLAVSLEWGEEG